MTSRERAEKAIFVSGFPQTDGETLRRYIVDAVDAAVAEEREACAKVASRLYQSGGIGSDIATVIRARGAK